MARARIDQRKRKPLGYSVPDASSGKDAWANARVVTDSSTEPLPNEARAPQAAADAPRRKATEKFTCICGCKCGSWTHDPAGLCYLCSKGTHHVCSRMCGEIPEMSFARGMKTPFLPRRAGCGGGGELGEGKWTPRYQSEVSEEVMKRATS